MLNLSLLKTYHLKFQRDIKQLLLAKIILTRSIKELMQDILLQQHLRLRANLKSIKQKKPLAWKEQKLCLKTIFLEKTSTLINGHIMYTIRPKKVERKVKISLQQERKAKETLKSHFQKIELFMKTAFNISMLMLQE